MRCPGWLLRPDGGPSLWAVIALALAARVLPVPFLLPLLDRVGAEGFGSDGVSYYLPLAHGLATRGEFSITPGAPTALHVPLFPIMLAGLERLGWGWPAAPVVVCQAFLGAVVLVLLFVWVRRLLGWRPATLALGIGGVLPDLAVYSYLPMSENLSLVLVLAALLAINSGSASGRPGWYALTGLLLGLAGLTREFCVTFLVPFGLWAILGASPIRAVARVGLMALIALLAIAPWSARNYLVFGELIPLADKAGLNVYIATLQGRYHPSDARRNWELDDSRQREVDQRLKAGLRLAQTSSERNRLYLAATLENLRQDPWGQVAYLPRKASFFWQANVGLRHHARLGLWPVLAFSEAAYWLVIAAAACSAFLPGAARRARLLLWLLVGWTFLFHLLVGEAEPRYHFMVLPALLALAASALDTSWKARSAVSGWLRSASSPA